jgi:hypothetical protein
VSINFGKLEQIICTKSVEAAIKYLMNKESMSRKEATEFTHQYMNKPGV